ncbi:MAG: glycosyltransferase, partial [Candidatus Hydrogenedentes bacterium]|nr:glycosyltransferase [Candidatus Hydrogenedentota bacterium]
MSASLSIVIPTLDHWDYLSECLASLREQTFRDFEVLVIDDGSQEDIEKRVSDAYPEVSVHRLPANRGFAVAAN